MEAIIAELLPRAQRIHSTAGCTLDTCSVKNSVYGYFPNKPVSIILVVLFGISMILHLVQGIRSKSWTFVAALTVGCFGEAVGEYLSFM